MPHHARALEKGPTIPNEALMEARIQPKLGPVDGRPTILVLIGCFSTGFEATGPNQNLHGMVRALSARYHFKVIAAAVAGDRVGEWGLLQGIEQLPLEVGLFGARGLRQAIVETPHDLLISNGFFDRGFTVPALLLRKLGLVPARPMLLGVHGEFSPGAISLSAGRKAAYITAARALGLLNGVALQATAELEADAIGQGLPFFKGTIFTTPVIRAPGPPPEYPPRRRHGPLKVAFLSRIDRMKNLDFALRCLSEADIDIDLSIYGPVSNEAYWATCQEAIERLPPRVSVTYNGPIGQKEVPAALATHDLFFLPTLGENYGHAIVDALAAGVPALISDQTLWRGLERAGAGWDLPLNGSPAFVAALRAMASKTPDEIARMRRAARAYVEEKLARSDGVAALEACFRQMLAPGPSATPIGRN